MLLHAPQVRLVSFDGWIRSEPLDVFGNQPANMLLTTEPGDGEWLIPIRSGKGVRSRIEQKLHKTGVPERRRLVQGCVPVFATLVDADSRRDEDFGRFPIVPDRQAMQRVISEFVRIVHVGKRHVTEIRRIADTVKDRSNFWLHELISAA